MTEAEWNTSSDAPSMIEALWRAQGLSIVRLGSPLPEMSPQSSNPVIEGLQKKLHRYYLSCCRAIWKLLPQKGSRQGIEVAERFLAGEVSEQELNDANYYAEGAAFCIDYNSEPEKVERWVEQTRNIPGDELRAILHPPDIANHIETTELLKRAAYFADFSMIYHHFAPNSLPPDSYTPFLAPDLLRIEFGNPFRLT